MITYVLILSQSFPFSHRRAGEPTYFLEKMHNALTGQDFCLHITGMDNSYGCTTLWCETIREKKLHTIRANYDLWAKRFEKIAAGKAVLSIRQWVGKPYGKDSTQQEIALLTKDDGIGIQRLEFENGDIWHPLVGGRSSYCPSEIAANDGLSQTDWMDWIRNYDLSKPMVIIHFTNFRYNR